MSAPFRIAFRVEAEFWVAYLASPVSMKDAVEMGRIRMTMARIPTCKDAFMTLMENSVAYLVKEAAGVDVGPFTTRPGPDHERGGNA